MLTAREYRQMTVDSSTNLRSSTECAIHQFFYLGYEIIGDCMAKQDSKSLVKFISIYGCPPADVSAAWNMIERSPPEDVRKNRSLKHLLWALALLRNYSTETLNSRLFDCHEDTWRYWTRIYVKALSKLYFKVVSVRFLRARSWLSSLAHH